MGLSFPIYKAEVITVVITVVGTGQGDIRKQPLSRLRFLFTVLPVPHPGVLSVSSSRSLQGQNTIFSDLSQAGVGGLGSSAWWGELLDLGGSEVTSSFSRGLP